MGGIAWQASLGLDRFTRQRPMRLADVVSFGFQLAQQILVTTGTGGLHATLQILAQVFAVSLSDFLPGLLGISQHRDTGMNCVTSSIFTLSSIWIFL